MAIQPTKENLVQYWQLFNKIEQLNGLHNSEANLNLKEVTLSSGKLTKFEGKDTSEVLLCPFTFEYHQTTIMPIWILAKVAADGQLSIHPTVHTPFIPNIYSQPQGLFGELLGKREVITVTINQLFGPEYQAKDWQSFVSDVGGLFEQLNPALYQLKKSEFKAYVIETEVTNIEPKGLASQWLEIPALEGHKNPKQPSLSSGFIAASKPETLTANFLETALKTLGLPEDSFQTIEAPISSAANDWVELMVLSLAARQFGKMQPLSVAVVSSDANLKFWDEGDWLETANQLMGKDFKKVNDISQDALTARWQQSLASLDKAAKAFEMKFDTVKSKVDACKSELLTLQLRDEKFEQKQDLFTTALNDWREQSKRSWLSKLWAKLTGVKQDEVIAEFLASRKISLKWDKSKTLEDNFIASSRAIKVKRTKIHRQLMVLTSDLAELEAILQAQQDCLQKYPDLQTLEGLEALLCLLKQTGEEACAYLKCMLQASLMPFEVKCFSPEQAAKLSDKQAFDWVFFVQGESLSPLDMIPLLGQAKRAVVLGDGRLSRTSEVSIDFDSFLAREFSLCDYDEELDDLQYVGHLMSQSSLYQLASGYSIYQSTDQTGLLRMPTLALQDLYIAEPFKDYFQGHLKIKANLHVRPGKLNFVAVEPSFSTDNGWENLNEANAIVEHAKKEAGSLEIVTLSVAQQQLIERLLAKAGLNIPVALLAHATPADTILFSSVYGAKASRPHLLDCGDGPLYRLMSLTHNLIWFGDEQLLVPTTHSPTGSIAKLLAAQSKQALTTE